MAQLFWGLVLAVSLSRAACLSSILGAGPTRRQSFSPGGSLLLEAISVRHVKAKVTDLWDWRADPYKQARHYSSSTSPEKRESWLRDHGEGSCSSGLHLLRSNWVPSFL